MPKEDKDQAIVALTSDQNQFERLTKAVEAIAARASITTVVQPRPLGDSAKEVAADYGRIADSLRTIFAGVRTTAPTAR